MKEVLKPVSYESTMEFNNGEVFNIVIKCK